jgi:PadR family transcriptional regulator, regulatory protein PadR
MEQDQWISAKWEITNKGRQAKFYAITTKGKKQLAEESENWARLTEGVMRVLKYS